MSEVVHSIVAVLRDGLFEKKDIWVEINTFMAGRYALDFIK